MAAAAAMCTIFVQQTERTRGNSPTKIKQLIAESDAKVTSLENEIAAVESKLATLIELHDHERAARDALRSLLAPIRTLPPELLAEIFVLTIRECESEEDRHFQLHSLHIKDAFRISHICRHWRQMAIGLPQLWTGPIDVACSEKLGYDQGENYVNGLRAWLARSAPLSVPIFIAMPMGWSWETELGARIMGELLRVASRLRLLRFPYGTVPSLIQCFANGRLDALEELVLSTAIRKAPGFDPTAVLSFAAAPRLRKLKIDLNNQIPMPWAQLTDIDIWDTNSSGTLLVVLAQCKSLVRASFTVRDWSIIHPPRKNDVPILNHLRVLTVRCFGEAVDEMSFLEYLSAPALDDLRLDFLCHPCLEWAEATFTALQQRSPNITKLRIRGNGTSLPPTALVAALRRAPSLTHLSVDHCPPYDVLFDALRHTDGVVPLVPHLHSLALAGMDADCSEDGLARTIASRWWTDAELAARSSAPVVARWRQIKLGGKLGDSDFQAGPRFRDTMEGLRQTGLVVDLLAYVKWDSDW